MSIDSVCVYGSGTLGWQIALQCASHGHHVTVYDISKEALTGAKRSIITELESRPTKDEMRRILDRIIFEAREEHAIRGVDLVIEAVPEKLIVKRNVFHRLDEICQHDTIIATNSSSIRVSMIEDSTRRLDRLLNTHFYSLPWRSRVVELMRGSETSDETINSVDSFMRSIGMIPLHVKKESTGFIFNRVWRVVKRECLHLVDEGVASYEDVDRAWMCIYGTGMGPFGQMDRVGLDVVRDIENVYFSESGDERDAPPKLLTDKVSRGELGIKTGMGFYEYPNPSYRREGWLEKQGEHG